MWSKRDVSERSPVVTVARRSLEALEAELARERAAGRALQAQLLREARGARRAREESAACRAGQEEALRALAAAIANERHALDALREARVLAAGRERDLAESLRGQGAADGRLAELERSLLELGEEREAARAEHEGRARRLEDAECARDEARARIGELELRLAERPPGPRVALERAPARPWLALAAGCGALAAALLPALALLLLAPGRVVPAGILLAAEVGLGAVALAALALDRRARGAPTSGASGASGAKSAGPHPAAGRADARR